MTKKLFALPKKRAHLVIGLMSGTSVDGVDAALCELSGRGRGSLKVKLLAEYTENYSPALRRRVLAACEAQGGGSAEICELNFLIGEIFARSANGVMRRAGFKAAEVDLIGSHGQTVAHLPPGRGGAASTLQLGEPAVIAERTGVKVVSNFRARDMAAGGEGAPLAPFVDYLLFSDDRETRVALNIGGIANVTYLPAVKAAPAAAAGVIAFDTGPGNMIIDALVQHATGGKQPFDHGGKLAASGRVNQKLLAALLRHKYFRRPPPKSTGREDFGAAYARKLRAANRALAPRDLIATATAFTARSIGAALKNFLQPKGPLAEVIVSGGGALNPVLLEMLQSELPGIKISTSAAHGLPVKAKECAAFAILARETALGRPANLPAATGAAGPRILGQITP
jgi:anhydro-N-acetylmuramic acid kinase